MVSCEFIGFVFVTRPGKNRNRCARVICQRSSSKTALTCTAHDCPLGKRRRESSSVVLWISAVA